MSGQAPLPQQPTQAELGRRLYGGATFYDHHFFQALTIGQRITDEYGLLTPHVLVPPDYAPSSERLSIQYTDPDRPIPRGYYGTHPLTLDIAPVEPTGFSVTIQLGGSANTWDQLSAMAVKAKTPLQAIPRKLTFHFEQPEQMLHTATEMSVINPETITEQARRKSFAFLLEAIMRTSIPLTPEERNEKLVAYTESSAEGHIGLIESAHYALQEISDYPHAVTFTSDTHSVPMSTGPLEVTTPWLGEVVDPRICVEATLSDIEGAYDLRTHTFTKAEQVMYDTPSYIGFLIAGRTISPMHTEPKLGGALDIQTHTIGDETRVSTERWLEYARKFAPDQPVQFPQLSSSPTLLKPVINREPWPDEAGYPPGFYD